MKRSNNKSQKDKNNFNKCKQKFQQNLNHIKHEKNKKL